LLQILIDAGTSSGDRFIRLTRIGGRFAVLKIRDTATESALCTGVILALLWGLGISVRGLLQGSGALSWVDWFLQLTLGIVVAIAVPPLLVRSTEWLARRIEGLRRRPSRVPQG